MLVNVTQLDECEARSSVAIIGRKEYNNKRKKKGMRCGWYVSLAPRAGQGSTAQV